MIYSHPSIFIISYLLLTGTLKKRKHVLEYNSPDEDTIKETKGWYHWDESESWFGDETFP